MLGKQNILSKLTQSLYLFNWLLYILNYRCDSHYISLDSTLLSYSYFYLGGIYIARYTLILIFDTHCVTYFYFSQNYLLKI